LKNVNRTHGSAPTFLLAAIALVFAVVSVVLAITLWTTHERQRANDSLAELQKIEIEALTAALETESMISAASLRQLRQVAAGGTLSALAQIHLPARETTPPVTIYGLWSDELAAGFLILPETSRAIAADHLQVSVGWRESQPPVLLAPTASKLTRIIGFNLPADRPAPEQLMVEVAVTGQTGPIERFVTNWER
jgi:hypothetical protein